MSRGARLAATIFAVLLGSPFPPVGARAEVFVSPGFEAKTGYVSNRFAEPGAEGSLYASFFPNVGVTWFAPDGIEAGLSIGYSYTDYLRSGYTSTRETTVGVDVLRSFRTTSVALSLVVGSYEDDSLPDDDSVWAELASSAHRQLSDHIAASLSGSVAWIRYDSRDYGDSETEIHGQLGPGFRWNLSPALAVWGGGFLEANDAEDDAEDYFGAGATAGVDVSPGGPVSAAAWIRWLVREYPESFSDDSQDRRDTPLSLGGSVDLRLNPWVELTGAGQWLWYRSTEHESDYDSWNLEAGLRFVFDWELTGEADR